MSNLIYDGGPAFSLNYMKPGMSLRDYFAAQALQGELASFANPGYSVANNADWTIETADRLARGTYVLADAMIRARGEKT